MARFEISSGEHLSEGSSASCDTLYQLGVMYATGRDVAQSLVEAHKWFNIAAFRGSQEAARYRRELSSEMTAAEISKAQREAREWISIH